MAAVETKFGTITGARADFGYGQVWLDDGSITYMDCCGYKRWKTVRGFERWADRQNAINGGVYTPIA